MTPRQRVIELLNHRPADRVAVDFGATMTTGIAASMVYRIKKHFGLLEPGERIKVVEPYQVLGEVDEKLRRLLGIDVVGVFAPNNMFGFRNENWKPWTLFDGTPVLVPEKFNTEPDQNGNIPMYAEGDKNYPPAAVMPKGGFYFDSISRQKPFDQANLDPRDNTEEFVPLGEADLQHYAEEVSRLYEQTDYAIAISVPGTAFGDIALVPGPFMKDPKGIRDVAEWYMSIALRPDYIKQVFGIQCEVALENLKALHKVVGDRVQVIFMSGTDFGAQNGPMISEATYRQLFLPYQKRLNDWVHENTAWKTFIHTCGAVTPLLDVIIEAGFDILNPVQCSAAGMDPAFLKAKYGDRLVFWGGGVDTQKTLPFGTPDQVRDEVAGRIRTFKENGGFVFNTIHNLQTGVPIENVEAMVQALQENWLY